MTGVYFLTSALLVVDSEIFDYLGKNFKTNIEVQSKNVFFLIWKESCRRPLADQLLVLQAFGSISTDHIGVFLVRHITVQVAVREKWSSLACRCSRRLMLDSLCGGSSIGL